MIKYGKFLEPGPIVLVSSKWKDKANIMTMGWHTVMEFSPSLIGCFITNANHSFNMIKKSGECVINIPTVDLIDEVISIGNSTGTLRKMTCIKKDRLKAEVYNFCFFISIHLESNIELLINDFFYLAVDSLKGLSVVSSYKVR